LGTVLDTITYTYGDTNWGDLLTAYDGTAITYDGIGNPLSGGAWSYAWRNGRELASMTSGDTTWYYIYDADGMRTSRTTDGAEYIYEYIGGQLTHMSYGITTMHFTYDAAGRPATVIHNGTVYYYVTNLQGDVVALLDSTGAQVVGYTYDAWGRLLSTTGSKASTLGLYNPLRYRGYVYDRETGLYYLQSRYYNPTIGRFINADAFTSTGQGLLGNNMFIYCLNNPINFVDRDGENAEALQWWSQTMWWLCGVDTALPIGDIIYVGGVIVLGAIALATSDDSTPEFAFDKADTTYGSPSPNHNDDDDDDDDDYYDDDSNFGGRQKIGKSNGNAPRNNQAQNKQFRDATKGLNADQQRIVHDKITGKGLGYHEIKSVVDDLFGVFIGVCFYDEWA